MKHITTLLLIGILCFSSVTFASNDEKTSTLLSKQDTIHVIGHAHQDMNWLWTYFETMKMCNDNLRQTVSFMKEFSDFTLLQSQVSVYNFVEKIDPPLFEEVKKQVKGGRLEIAGGMWTEGDMNLSSGEAITRSFLLGQRYFQKHFGKMAQIGWLPDNFGHISQMPQILNLAECNYFYFHRCKPFKGSFWWEGTDKSKVLCYANDTYNGDIYPELKEDFQIYAPGRNHLLQITGVGDHGGGPTRKNIEKIHELDKDPNFPAIKFTTVNNFFKAVERNASGLPVHRGEMQYIFEGCYTTVADIKEGNRNCETMLYGAEFFNTLRWLNGGKYPATELRDLWTNVTFNQFHDILPGSAINEANKEAVARYVETLRMATELRNGAFFRLADEVKFKTGMGQPVVAYNLQPVSRKMIVEAEVFSHENPVTISAASWGNYYAGKNIRPVKEDGVASVLVRDGEGKTYPAQIVYSKTTPPGVTSKVQFIVDDFPAGGYKTFYIDTQKPGQDNTIIPSSDNTFETKFFKIKVDMKTGGIISLIDKRNNVEYVREGEQLNKLRIYLEDKKGGMKSWNINRFVNHYDVTDVRSVELVENGPVRACIQTEKAWGKSKFIERMYIYRDYPRIEYDMEVHWLETGNPNEDSPFLRAIFPLAMKDARFYNQVPFDIIERPADGMLGGETITDAFDSETHGTYGISSEINDGQEVPAQKWVTVTDGQKGIALLNKTKYGHSYEKGDLRISLMRAAGEPDIYPNLGKFNISYALYPHLGDWKSDLWAEGENYNAPVYAAEPPSLSFGKEHATRPEELSFLKVAPANVSMTGMKQSEEGNELIIRLVEIEGKETTATVNLPINAKQVRRLNILEYPLKGAITPKVNGKTVTVTLKPNEIVTLGIK